MNVCAVCVACCPGSFFTTEGGPAIETSSSRERFFVSYKGTMGVFKGSLRVL